MVEEKKVIGFNKIVNHPDKDEIIERLLGGESVRSVAAWLKQKHPRNSKLHVSYISLQSFRKGHLDIDSAVLQKAQQERKNLLALKKQEVQKEKVQKIESYQVGLANYVQDSLIDYNSEILKMMDEVREGIDSLKALNEAKGSHLNHQAIAAYLVRYESIIETHRKMISDQEKKAGDRLSADYEELSNKMDIFKEAVKETFNETNPEALFVFMDKVKEKMQEAGLLE